MARRISVEIVGDSRSLERAFARSEKSAKQFNSTVGRQGRSAFGGLGRSIGFVTGALGAAGFAGAAHAAFQELADSQKVAAQTEAVLKSTGNAANVTADQMSDLAGQLMNLSGVDDEAIQSGENLLATFTNIHNEVGKGNDIFNQATRAALDMSVALGQDMSQSAIQLGKALNDPVRGVTALRRVGVSFTADQQKMIKSLVASGKTLDAQKLILRELQKEFGGSAKAAGETLPGKLSILRENLLNLGGSIAETLTPAINDVVDRMLKWMQNSKNQKQVLDTVKQITDALAGALRVLSQILTAVNRVTGSTANTLKILLGVLVAIKALNMAASLTTTARALGLMSTSATAAQGSVGLLRGSLIGKLGLAAALGVASYELTKFALKATGLDKKIRGVSESIAGALGVGGEPAAALSPGAYRYLRRQAARLEAGGMTPAQAAARIAVTHPGVQRRDIDVIAGVRGARPTIVINNLHTGARNARELEADLMKQHRGRPAGRRGAR